MPSLDEQVSFRVCAGVGVGARSEPAVSGSAARGAANSTTQHVPTPKAESPFGKRGAAEARSARCPLAETSANVLCLAPSNQSADIASATTSQASPLLSVLERGGRITDGTLADVMTLDDVMAQENDDAPRKSNAAAFQRLATLEALTKKLLTRNTTERLATAATKNALDDTRRELSLTKTRLEEIETDPAASVAAANATQNSAACLALEALRLAFVEREETCEVLEARVSELQASNAELTTRIAAGGDNAELDTLRSSLAAAEEESTLAVSWARAAAKEVGATSIVLGGGVAGGGGFTPSAPVAKRTMHDAKRSRRPRRRRRRRNNNKKSTRRHLAIRLRRRERVCCAMEDAHLLHTRCQHLEPMSYQLLRGVRDGSGAGGRSSPTSRRRRDGDGVAQQSALS